MTGSVCLQWTSSDGPWALLKVLWGGTTQSIHMVTLGARGQCTHSGIPMSYRREFVLEGKYPDLKDTQT